MTAKAIEVNETKVQLQLFKSIVDVNFWFRLVDLKKDVFKLDDKARPILAICQGRDHQAPTSIVECFKNECLNLQFCMIQGLLMNQNTLEDYADFDYRKYIKTQLEVYKEMLANNHWEKIEIGDFCNFFLVSYADLKKYKFHYTTGHILLTHGDLNLEFQRIDFTLLDYLNIDDAYSYMNDHGLQAVAVIANSFVRISKLNECSKETWKTAPDLDLEKISSLRCLLVGAGTLGCNVARCLLGWNIKCITFIDNGVVSPSNPVRQSLFVFDDCKNGGQYKAEVAAQRLKDIYPNVDCKGMVMSVPMPGHSIGDPASFKNDLAELMEVISLHDVIFLLTDSRESRWLPTLLGRLYNKIVISVAIGFDSFLVIRHGLREYNNSCYFCQDVIAPTNVNNTSLCLKSLQKRTLDQQCTVTRPGISMIASGTAVELLTSYVQSNLAKYRNALIDTSIGESVSNSTQDTLGTAYQQIRGFLSTYEFIKTSSPRFNECVACSEKIINEFKSDNIGFLERIFNNPGILEEISGISSLKKDLDQQELEISFSEASE
ncbi:NAD(P)-binding domain-containing protein [Rozella allomycis CSF55]|uniref:NAD(P)-binding domain-containing protein n=1 Tax=Rozella allomycis (strain CSF55) TaxID=988480 RepID=A0A075AV81_ROZAC|nr:NAD(P)-binding domain-containing protein [Rozella allomycis CSF55]|eukprot:EPZ32587.1 NAD(P)-binding domain-containing protein [Rozella allomycis CSF55]